jgi:hypothetical protein
MIWLLYIRLKCRARDLLEKEEGTPEGQVILWRPFFNG